MINIPLSNPDITEAEKLAVLEVLGTSNLSLGPKVDEFEKAFADYVGMKYAVAVNSGTSGLHLCVRAISTKPGDVFLTTPFSFIASANCAIYEGAKPVFVDIDEKTLNIDVGRLRDAILAAKKINQKIKGIIPVHVFGRPCEMPAIQQLAAENGLSIIEDSCEAIGAQIISPDYAWRKTGTFGDCAVFAFYPNKQMTTGEGGMIVTNNEAIYRRCRSERNQGRGEGGGWLQHQGLGYNYRLSDINCALGVCQLRRIDELLAKRSRMAGFYQSQLADMSDIILPIEEPNKRISWFVYVIRLADKFSRADRDVILDNLRAAGIGCSNYFTPIHLQPFYKEMFGYHEGDFPITEKISERTIALPFYNNLTEMQVEQVVTSLRMAIKQIPRSCGT